MAGNTDYERELVAWRMQRLEKLTADDGWLSLVGLHWLEPGDNAFGRDASNRIGMDCAALPEHVGTFRVNGREVRFVAGPDALVFNGAEAVRAIGPLRHDADGAPTVLRCGSVSFHLVVRDGRCGIRLKDARSEARVHFKGLEYFPADPKWRLEAHVEPYAPARTVSVATVLGVDRAMVSPGALLFEVDGQPCRLDAVRSGDSEWFVMFADETNAQRTYRGGRYLHVTSPAGGRTVIDFNKSYAPPCAFSAFATCPLPPPQNRLAVAVTAGELRYLGPQH